ncbi:subtilisin-like protein [Wolfiporia cocos MD-104 SS10]|uniref:tripeptidyl-peptidase II n=1 Tax=Wolfiporia cocos (strain MD-104) TaxID=742152 RepID=A0A2H3K9E9_WOLCO|nr:subtilisin-like protein [Wolfiporia cocos MD-104 SS10]
MLCAAGPLVVLTLGLLAAGAAVSPRVLHESRSAPPSGWHAVRRAERDTALPLRVGLAQQNLDKLEDYLLDVSHPDSPNYGRHWTAGQVAQTFRPSTEATEAVRAWLLAEGVDAQRIKLSKSGGWVGVDVTVAEAENLLKTRYHVYQYGSEGRVTEHIACSEGYHLPEHVSYHVDVVMPTLHFDVKVRERLGLERRSSRSSKPNAEKMHSGIAHFKTVTKTESNPTDLADCDKQITPNCLRALYNFTYTLQATQNNTVGIVEYSPNAYLDADLDAFFGNFSPSLVGQRPGLVSIDGGYEQTSFAGISINGEADLDVQYAMALVGPTQNVTVYQVGDTVEGGTFNTFLDALDATYCTFEGGDDPSIDPVYPDPYGGYNGTENCGTAPLSYIFSTSYGFTEAYLGSAYIQRQCAEYAKLGLMGVTFIYASGDNGVAGNGECLDATGSESWDGTRFDPGFPSTCPYVTSVGATQIVPGNSVSDKEVACDKNIYSGGGFSNVFALPDWQKDAVQGYLTNYPPPYNGSVYNSTGNSRAYPDIAANGLNYTVVIDGSLQLVAGTSCAAPVVAAILTGVNDARLAAGKGPIGFINPTIYTPDFIAAFNDITSGNNPGCGTDGFSAEPGWDPVTGLGTPNFDKLRARWLELP